MLVLFLVAQTSVPTAVHRARKRERKVASRSATYAFVLTWKMKKQIEIAKPATSWVEVWGLMKMMRPVSSNLLGFESELVPALV